MLVVLPLLPLGSWFPEGSWPRMPCGKCVEGELQISAPNKIDVSAQYRADEGWEPDWIHGYFSVQAECTNRDCRSIGIVVGKMQLGEKLDHRGRWQNEWEYFYKLSY